MSLPESLLKYLRVQQEIPFVEFMQLALYSPEFGYYSGSLPKFGPQGDFITAPELTPLFAQTLANQCQQILGSLSNPVLFEFGAGSGKLAVELLKRLEQLHCLPAVYYILEVSPDLHLRQKALIQQEIPHLAERLVWLSAWPEQAIKGVMIANEVLDAMPVHRFLQSESGLYESYVALDEKNELTERFKPCSNSRLQDYVQAVLPSGLQPYQSEANLFVEGWLQQCAAVLQQGAVILIDYGFPGHEYYHPDRNQGSLMCHYQHRAHSNPLIHVGQQDITAHVNFTQVAEAALTAGFHVAGYTDQAAFLLANGLLHLLQDIEDENKQLQAKQAVKQLVQPNEMGELFKVMMLTRELDLTLTGFQLQDKRASL